MRLQDLKPTVKQQLANLLNCDEKWIEIIEISDKDVDFKYNGVDHYSKLTPSGKVKKDSIRKVA